MATAKSLHRSEVIEELDKIPSEYFPTLLKLMQAFREGVALPSAEESFRQGWREAQAEETHPISELWEDTDAA